MIRSVSASEYTQTRPLESSFANTAFGDTPPADKFTCDAFDTSAEQSTPSKTQAPTATPASHSTTPHQHQSAPPIQDPSGDSSGFSQAFERGSMYLDVAGSGELFLFDEDGNPCG